MQRGSVELAGSRCLSGLSDSTWIANSGRLSHQKNSLAEGLSHPAGYFEMARQCSARAEFRKTWVGWELNAAGQSKFISEILPKDKNKIARVLERIGADDPVHYVIFLREIGECK